MKLKMEKIIKLNKQENKEDAFKFIEETASCLFNKIKPLFENDFKIPMIELILSYKDTKALGYYYNEQIGIVVPSFYKTFSNITEQEIPLMMLQFRIIFTIAHELGHHMFSLENEEKKAKEKREFFRGVYVNSKDKTKEEIMNCNQMKTLFFNASESCVNEEIYADDFAYSFIQNHFPEISEQPYYIEFKKERPKIYKHYTTSKIASAIATRIHHLPKDEKIEIAKHYIETTIKLQNLI